MNFVTTDTNPADLPRVYVRVGILATPKAHDFCTNL